MRHVKSSELHFRLVNLTLPALDGPTWMATFSTDRTPLKKTGEIPSCCAENHLQSSKISSMSLSLQHFLPSPSWYYPAFPISFPINWGKSGNRTPWIKIWDVPMKSRGLSCLVGGDWLPFLKFSHIITGFLIIPIDELIFFRGVAQPPTSCRFPLPIHWFSRLRPEVECDGLRRRAEVLGGMREEILQARRGGGNLRGIFPGIFPWLLDFG